MKKFLVSVAIMIGFCLGILWANVQTKSEFQKYYKFEIKAGQRILVIDSGATTNIRISPSEARIFDYKVPEGKEMKGVLIEK